MPLPYKPHTLTVWDPDENVHPTTLVVRQVYYTNSRTVRGQLTPMTAQAAMERTGIEVARPHLFLFDDPTDIVVVSLARYGDRYFVAAKPAEVWDAEPTTACKSIVLEEIDADAVIAANEDL